MCQSRTHQADAPYPTGPDTPFYVYHDADRLLEVHLHEPRTPARVPERLVHDIWAQQRFDRSACAVGDGRRLSVLHPGLLNGHGGPDFRDARIDLGEEAYRGDVEIHVFSGDWQAHGHQEDPAYNRTILHVTLFPDVFTGRLRRADGILLPELVVFPLLQTSLRGLLYDFHRLESGGLPCAPMWGRIDAYETIDWIAGLGRNRLTERKSELANAYLTRPETEALLHRRLFHALGAEPNGEAMEELASRLPLPLLRSLDTPLDAEALHLGVAGFLPVAADELARSDRPSSDAIVDLEQRFERINARLHLAPMARSRWQFFRLRPANFPTLRIAQAAALTAPNGWLYHDPIGRLTTAARSAQAMEALTELFESTPSAYWTTHFRFGKRSRGERSARIGRPRLESLVVNALAPAVLLVAEQQDDPVLEEAGMALLRRCKPERDRVTALFEALGTPKHALATQGMHALYRGYCRHARCLECAIGQRILGATPGG
ncbi:MAG: DUF2851 family protein [Rhodothermales bacterium]|nr:DUF2851 family protein [Rhodothermales bacterium]